MSTSMYVRRYYTSNQGGQVKRSNMVNIHRAQDWFVASAFCVACALHHDIMIMLCLPLDAACLRASLLSALCLGLSRTVCLYVYKYNNSSHRTHFIGNYIVRDESNRWFIFFTAIQSVTALQSDKLACRWTAISREQGLPFERTTVVNFGD